MQVVDNMQLTKKCKEPVCNRQGVPVNRGSQQWAKRLVNDCSVIYNVTLNPAYCILPTFHLLSLNVTVRLKINFEALESESNTK